MQNFGDSDCVKMGTDLYTWRIRIGCFSAKLCNKILNLASRSSCFKGFVTCLGLSQLTISNSVLIVLLLSAGGPNVQLLEDCHLTNKQAIKVIKNFLRTQSVKNIDSFNLLCDFCHVITDGTANTLLLHCMKKFGVAHLSCLVCNYKKSCKVSLKIV